MSIRVRFAPSPTGNLHIGSVRTALFNFLFARHHKGQFLIRIEDTDQERSKKEYEQDILTGLQWLGMQSDEPLVYQASRIDIHKKYIEKLLAEGKAYKDKDTPAIYFKAPTEGETIIADVVKGPISFQNKDFKDQVILKSDGSVTYNFGVVIDDAEMGITHVIRGEDHISNTPKQIFFYQALGFQLPKFAHIPMILGPDRSKLSKRHGATSINEYRKQGYLPEAINNYLALLGWTPADGQELMTIAELINKFDLDRASKSNSIFDLQKLQWLNGQKLRQKNNKEILELVKPFARPEFNSLIEQDLNKAELIIEAVKDNLTLLTDFDGAIESFFTVKTTVPGQPETKVVISLFLEKIKKLNQNYLANIKTADQIIAETVTETGLKKGQVLKPLRLALTGLDHGPGLKYIIGLLDPQIIEQRLKKCV